MPEDALTRLRHARHLLLAHLGTENEVLALGPALGVLRGELPAARLTLLTSADGLWAAPYLPVTAAIRAPLLTEPAGLRQLIARLQQETFDAAVIFTAPGESPHTIAYCAYLAGIPVRLGASPEFAGQVLDPWVAPTAPQTLPALRHLHLLAQGGFEEARSFIPQDTRAAGQHPVMKA